MSSDTGAKDHPQGIMHAILIKDGKGPIENLYLGEAPIPVPEKDQVLVKVKAFGLNRMDLSQREGKYPPPPGWSSILGVEFSGTVTSVGPTSPSGSKWKVGDEVLGLAGGGAYAEYIVVPAGNLLAKPSHLSWVDAASVPENFLTAYQALVLVCELKKGEDVLIHAGASGVGIAAIQIARVLGQSHVVFTTASSHKKLDLLLSMPNGATHAANYKTENWAEGVKRATDDRGVDVIVDFVGKTHWEGNIESLAVDGRMVILSSLSGADVPNVNLSPILYKRLRIQGSTLRSRSLAYQAELIQRFNTDVFADITGQQGNGPIKAYVHKVYEWSGWDVQAAHREMAENGNVGKIIVEIL